MNREDVKQTMLLAMSEHHSGNAAEAQRIVDAILTALEAAGVRLVPVEATEEMYLAGQRANAGPRSTVHGYIYDAMLSASPYAPQKEESND